ALVSVPAGRLADRIGKKKVLTIGLLVFGLGAIIGSQAGDIVQATIALAVVGIGNAGTTTQINPLLVDLIPRKRTAELLGLGSSVWSFAQPLGSVFAGLAVEITRLLTVGSGVPGPPPATGTSIANMVQVAERIDRDSVRAAFLFAGVMVVLASLVLQSVRPERVRLD